MKAVILAGGFGERLKSVNKDIPKPMSLISGKSVLEHQIVTLKKEGITDFIFIIGYLGDVIENYFQNGQAFGVNISYFRETQPLGTAGAIFKLDLTEDFLVCNGDLIFDFDLSKMVDFHHEKNALATLFTHPNSHPYDSVLVCTDSESRVTEFIPKNSKPEFYNNLCNAGIEIISPELLRLCRINGKADLDRDVIMPNVKTKRIFSYKSSEYVHDMGTPERLMSVETDMKSGIVSSRNFKNVQRAVFLDRDGTVNVHKGFITDPYQIELISGVSEAIRKFNSLGYLVIIITNQPVIARGECTEETLAKIHSRLQMLLGQKGAYVDGIYYCVHHPDKGFDGEVAELKISCECRKPAPGLIFKAQKDFNVDLSNSFMVGDSVRDVRAGKNAGCKTVLLTDKSSVECDCDAAYDSLISFAKALK